MKNIRRICLVTILAIVFSTFFSLGVFAQNGKRLEVESDFIYAQLPEGYEVCDDYEDDTALFYENDNGDIITVDVFKNDKAPNGITALSEDEIKELTQDIYFEYFFGDDFDFDLITKTTVNGMSAYKVIGEYEVVFDCKVCAYFFAVKEFTVFVAYEPIDDVIVEDDINELLSTLAFNGTFFDGDVPTVKHDFPPVSAETYSNLPSQGAADIAEDVYDDSQDGFQYIYTLGFVKAVMIAIFIVPFILVVIIAVIFAVLYFKKKKQLREYERMFAFENPANGYYPQPNVYQNQNPVQPQNFGYQNPVMQQPDANAGTEGSYPSVDNSNTNS